MLNFIVLTSLLFAGSAQAADPFYVVTCSAQLRNKVTGEIEEFYEKTRSGPSYDYARDLAEENVLEVCTKYLILSDLGNDYTCDLLSCSQDEPM